MRNMAIPQFLKETLPQQSKEFNFHAPSTWFRNEEPTPMTVEEIFEIVWRQRSILPPRDVLTKLQEEFCQQWLDGSKSIVDPRFNQGHEKLPFWVLSLWIQVSKIRQKQEDWREAYTCVVEETRNPVIAAEFPNAQCFFGARGWDADIEDNGNKLTAHAVAQLLCRQQLFCEVTELMVQNLQERLAAARTKHPHHVIASSRLYTIFDLERTKFHQKESLPKTLQRRRRSGRDRSKVDSLAPRASLEPSGGRTSRFWKAGHKLRYMVGLNLGNTGEFRTDCLRT